MSGKTKNSSSQEGERHEECETDSTLRNILLIGASQNGKSSLANFLFTGECIEENPTYPIGDGLKSCTKDYKEEILHWEYHFLPENVHVKKKDLLNPEQAKIHKKTKKCSIRIIDTPGVGDCKEESEADNMKRVYDMLLRMRRSNEHLSLALLVVKYPVLLDDKLQQNLTFYKKMLPGLIDGNLFLVITHVECNENWIKKQLRGSKVSPREKCEVIRKDIIKWLNIEYDINMIPIDTMFNPGSPEEEQAKNTRDLIFGRCMESPGVSLYRMRLPKTQKMIDDDELAIKKLKVDKETLTNNCAHLNELDSEYKRTISYLREEISSVENQLEQCKSEYEANNTEELVVIKDQTFNDEWKLFSLNWKPKVDFDITTEFIIRHKTVAGGCADYEIEEETHVKGRVYCARFFTDMKGCVLTLSTFKRDYHKKLLESLQNKIKTLSGNLVLLKHDNDRVLKACPNSSGSIAELNNKLAEIDKKISRLQNEYIDLSSLS